jgi:hypothetical protein
MSHLTGLLKAKRHYYDSQKALAKAIGRPRQTITSWINREGKIPDLLDVFRLLTELKGAISLRELTKNTEEIRQLINSVSLYDKYPAVELSIDKLQIIRNCPFYKEAPQIFHSPHHDLSLPILIDNANQLITCECRIRENKISNHKKIFVHRIDLVQLINQKMSVTELLDVLPISEKVAIGLAIEQTLGKRQGKRTDLKLPQISAEVISRPITNKSCRTERAHLEPLQTGVQIKRGLETRKIAAVIAGFSTHFLYGYAKEVVAKGIPELIKAMDNKICSISKANRITKLSQEKQLQELAALKTSQKITDRGEKYGKNPHSQT